MYKHILVRVFIQTLLYSSYQLCSSTQLNTRFSIYFYLKPLPLWNACTSLLPEVVPLITSESDFFLFSFNSLAIYTFSTRAVLPIFLWCTHLFFTNRAFQLTETWVLLIYTEHLVFACLPCDQPSPSLPYQIQYFWLSGPLTTRF